MGDDEPRAGRPWVYGKPARAAHRGQGLAIDDCEGQAEFGFQLVLPLERHRRRGRDHDAVDPPPQQQLSDDQPRLDRLAETDVVGDQQIDPRQPQSLSQWRQLIGVEPDAGAERRLKEVAIGGSGRAPLQRF